jgi:hypothetical protein
LGLFQGFSKYLIQSEIRRGLRWLQTPPAAMAISACGDDQFRVRRWQIPRAAFGILAAGICFCPTWHHFFPCISMNKQALRVKFFVKI